MKKENKQEPKELIETVPDTAQLGNIILSSTCFNCEQLANIIIGLLENKEVRYFLELDKLKKINSEAYLG